MSFNEAEIFDWARNIQPREARNEYLDQACPDTASKQRIERLLAEDHDDSFLENPAIELTKFDQAIEPGEQIGTNIGPYKLLELIGEGGMGMVYMAEQVVPVKRIVAIKLIKFGNAHGPVTARFEAERQALALMDHPNIAKFYDAGTAVCGNLYFVMEFVSGTSVTRHCDQQRSSIEDRLILFRQICQAVAHAHKKGIIHRDLKPSNVLVTMIDDQPVPKIIDFGLAKATGTQLNDRTIHTNFGQVLGTFQYMSPEQAGANSADVDVRSDIYSLGAILYELLVGSPPFQKEQVKQRALDEVLRMIREEDPPTPRRRFSSLNTNSDVASCRRIDVAKLNRLVKSDLEWIVMKSLAKERERRYQTIDAFADDVQRFIQNKPVEARPANFRYRSRKFLRRNRASASMVGGILVTMVIGIVLTAGLIDQTRKASRAQGLVGSLLTADSDEVPGIINQLDDYREWARKDLVNAYETSSDNSDFKLNAALALLSEDESVLDYLKQRMLIASPLQLSIIRKYLYPFRRSLSDDYWSIAVDRQQDKNQRFRAACALAAFDPKNANWKNEDFSQFLAHELVDVLPSELLPWQNAFRPVKEDLIGALSVIYKNENEIDKCRFFATVTLADYAGDDVETLFTLLVEADQSQFPITFAQIENWRDRAIELGTIEVSRSSVSSLDHVEQERQAIRKANAALMLIRLGRPEHAWPVLAASANPGARSRLIHLMGSLGVESNLIIDQIRLEQDISIKRALIQSLGEYEMPKGSDREQHDLTKLVLEIFRTQNDAGLHSSAEWLLRSWCQFDQINSINNELHQTEAQLRSAQNEPRQWYINTQGQTFALITATETEMGSPETEPGHRPDENMHRRRIDRRIAISTTAVTLEQWRKFTDSVNLDEKNRIQFRKHSDSKRVPVTAVSWYDAAWYCNWLSQQEGIAEEQWCYQPNREGKYSQGMQARDRFWELDGYRLPTAAEWNFACRAGTSTCRSFGHSDFLLSKYAWYNSNSNDHLHPVSLLKPNGHGLFDVHGNVWEWSYDTYQQYPDDPKVVTDDFPSSDIIEETVNRVVQGGGYNSQPINVRSAMRTYHQPGDFRNFNTSFRPTRTFRSSR